MRSHVVFSMHTALSVGMLWQGLKVLQAWGRFKAATRELEATRALWYVKLLKSHATLVDELRAESHTESMLVDGILSFWGSAMMLIQYGFVCKLSVLEADMVHLITDLQGFLTAAALKEQVRPLRQV